MSRTNRRGSQNECNGRNANNCVTPKTVGADCEPRRARMHSPAPIVVDYRRNYQAQARQELRFFEEQQTLADAIRRAGLATRLDGKRFSHQRRLAGGVLIDSERSL